MNSDPAPGQEAKDDRVSQPAWPKFREKGWPGTERPDFLSPEALLEACADGVAVLDTAGKVLFANPAFRNLLSQARVDHGSWPDLLPRDGISAFHKALGLLRNRPHRDLRLEITLERESGGRWVEAVLRNRLDDPRIGGVLVQTRDISGCRRALEELKTRKQILDVVLANMPVMACRIDKHGFYRESFGAGLRKVDLKDGQRVGEKALDSWPDNREDFHRALAGESVHFNTVINRTGRKQVYDIWFVPDSIREGGIIGFGVDVTSVKQTEDDLGKSEALSRRIIESSRDCIMVLDDRGVLLSMSDSGRRLLEIDDIENLLNTSWFDLWKGEDAEKARTAVSAAIRLGVGKFQGYAATLAGKPKWWDIVITPILNPEGDTERLLAVSRDITEHKRFEDSLRRSKDQFEAILKAISDSVLVSDFQGQIVYANDAALRLTGLSTVQDLLDMSLDQLARDFEIRDEEGKVLSQAALLTGKSPGRVVRFRNCRDGREKWAVLNAAAIRDGKGGPSLYITSAYDITERKHAEDALRQSEEQLRQSQKMEAIGRLAGGVAHDFNNLLTAINGYSDLLIRSMAEGNPYRDSVEEIRRAGERAATLTRQLLTFSRKQVLDIRILDLNQVLAEIKKMLGRLIGEDIEMVTLLEEGEAMVSGDPGQIEQVVLNLAVNARDAMPQGGRLTLQIANTTLDRGQVGAFFVIAPGPYVRLTVSDTGIGMSPEVKAHLFEPFFTTKPSGQGTGLGLSTVYGIVKQAGGNLSVWSEVGRGSSISVYLPAARGSEGQKPVGPNDLPERRSARETVLLVEDESMVRKLLSQVLAVQGYTVLEADSGPAALEVAARHPGAIDLLLTDVVMVGMSGRELAAKLVEKIPGLKVLYMSGYTDDAILRHGVLQNSAAFLGKPFSPGALVRKLRELLEEPTRPVPAPKP